jgi:hypothetical protein
MEVEVEKCVHLRVDDQHDTAAAPAVTAVGPTERFEFLAMNRGAAVAAVARPRVDHDPVDKPRGHGDHSLVETDISARKHDAPKHRFRRET